MSDTIFVQDLSAGIGLILLGILYYLIVDYKIDSLRDELFDLRDRMFLYAHDNGLSDSAAYTNLRVLMNGLIRYAHRISFSRLILRVMAGRVAGIEIAAPREFLEWQKAVECLPEDQKKRFMLFHQNSMVLATKHMILSPVFLSITIATVLCVIGSQLIAVISKRSLRAADHLIENAKTAIQDHAPLGQLEIEAFKAAA